MPGPSLPSHGAGPAAPLVLVHGFYFCLYVHFKEKGVGLKEIEKG